MRTLSYQTKAINELVDKFNRLLTLNGDRKKLLFEAPTGSGKTVMVSEMLRHIVEESADDCNVAFIWLAPNKLHEQSYAKLKDFYNETKALKTITYNEIDTSDKCLHPGHILFLNWESCNKDNAVIIRDGEHDSSLFKIADNTKYEKDITLVVIIDEENMFTGKSAKQSEKVLQRLNAKIEIRISATPLTRNPDELVKVHKEDVIKEEMIKKTVVLNPALKENEDNDIDTTVQYLLKHALEKRKELADAYKAMGSDINPLLLIQLPNDSSEKVTDEEESLKLAIVTALDNTYTINESNNKLAVWLSKSKDDPSKISGKINTTDIEKNNAVTEVLLFKQAIALGWDCPRASVLLIFRQLGSFQFSMQTVGRILRMPEQKHYDNDILNKGYVYTNLSKRMIEIIRDDMDYITDYVAYRAMPFNNIVLNTNYYQRVRPSDARNRLGSKFKGILRNVIAEKWLDEQQTTIKLFVDITKPVETPNAEKGELFDQYARNKEKAGKYINFDVKSIVIEIPRDFELEVTLGEQTIDKFSKKPTSKAELDTALTDYCEPFLKGFELSHSLKVLKNALIDIMDSLFGINYLFEPYPPKVILYHLNRPKFSDVIKTAIERYLKYNEKKKESRKLTTIPWEIPGEREYCKDTHEEIKEKNIHALQSFYRLSKAPETEKQFEEFLNRNSDCIDWWYKNGDSGREHFAIPYAGNKLFYVDFVIRMKNGQIFLFDTKSGSIDSEMFIKHNALVDYMESERNLEQQLRGGIIMKVNEDWYYPPSRVNELDHMNFNTAGWVQYNPQDYGQQQ